MIYILLLAVLSLVGLVYNGSKYAVSDGVRPDNVLVVKVSIVVSGLLFLLSLIALVLI